MPWAAEGSGPGPVSSGGVEMVLQQRKSLEQKQDERPSSL